MEAMKQTQLMAGGYILLKDIGVDDSKIVLNINNYKNI